MGKRPHERAEAPPSWTSGELARLLNVDLKTIHNWVNQGHIDGRRTPGRHLRFDRMQVVRFMRDFEYPIPREVTGETPRVLIDSLRGAEWQMARALSRRAGVRVSTGLFETAMALAEARDEIVIFDLDRRDLDQVGQLVRALRGWPTLTSLWVVGVGRSAGSRQRFLASGADVSLPSGRRSEMYALLSWLVGSVGEPPRRAELAEACSAT